MLYFSYGSNMSTPRLADRISSARPVAVAQLAGHQLRFRKVGRDGSAKCDIEQTSQAENVVHGVVFEIGETEKPLLDRFEGLGHGYEQKTVSLITQTGETLEAITYYATRIDPAMAPFDWYQAHVLRGAREHGLPPDYIAAIEAIPSVPDPDEIRREKETSIYR